jgi:hypothetical protein
VLVAIQTLRCGAHWRRGNRACGQLWRHGNIKFEAAGDRQLVALQAQSQKAIAVFFILRRNQRDATEQPTHKFPQFGVAFGGTFRQTGVGDDQRDFTFVQRGDHIRPQLGFHHDNQLRLHRVEEAVHCAGQIVRQIDMVNIFAEGGHGAL